jgi:uncharacterized protein YkwD
MRHATKTTLTKATLIVSAVLAACVLAAPAPAPAATPSCPGAGAMPLTVSRQAFETTILCMLNRERTSRGLVPLRIDPKLDALSLGHSVSMRQLGYFEHDDPNGSTLTDRILGSGYARGARRWLAGENIAWGERELGTPQSLMTAWMNSPPHRADILEPRFREIGVGVDWGSPVDPSATATTITTDFGLVKRRR